MTFGIIIGRWLEEMTKKNLLRFCLSEQLIAGNDSMFGYKDIILMSIAPTIFKRSDKKI